MLITPTYFPNSLFFFSLPLFFLSSFSWKHLWRNHPRVSVGNLEERIVVSCLSPSSQLLGPDDPHFGEREEVAATMADFNLFTHVWQSSKYALQCTLFKAKYVSVVLLKETLAFDMRKTKSNLVKSQQLFGHSLVSICIWRRKHVSLA